MRDPALALRRNNFDLLRLAFAATVAAVHAHVLSGEAALAPISAVLSSSVAVDGFFVISGFLITQSYLGTSNATRYAGKRLRRIYPGYVAVVLATTAAGTFVTELSPSAYLRSAEVGHHLAANLTFLNFLAPGLPGVFSDNPAGSAINGALWSIRIEVLCYCGVPLLCALARRAQPWLVCASVVSVCAVLAAWLEARAARTGSELLSLIRTELPIPVACFVCGAAVRFHLDAFRRRGSVLLACAALALLARGLAVAPVLTEALFPPALAIAVLYAALLLPYAGNFARFGDLSYGVYLWHFPVLQLLVSMGAFAASPIGALLGAAVAVGLLALGSWHGIERPFLARDSHYRRAARRAREADRSE